MASDSTTLELLGLVADIYEMHTRKSIAHSQIEANQEEAEWELEHLQKINNQKRNTQLQQSLLIKEYDRNINELSNLEAKAKQYGLTFNDWEYLDDNDQTKEGKEILTKAGVSLGNDFDIRYVFAGDATEQLSNIDNAIETQDKYIDLIKENLATLSDDSKYVYEDLIDKSYIPENLKIKTPMPLESDGTVHKNPEDKRKFEQDNPGVSFSDATDSQYIDWFYKQEENFEWIPDASLMANILDNEDLKQFINRNSPYHEINNPDGYNIYSKENLPENVTIFQNGESKIYNLTDIINENPDEWKNIYRNTPEFKRIENENVLFDANDPEKAWRLKAWEHDIQSGATGGTTSPSGFGQIIPKETFTIMNQNEAAIIETHKEEVLAQAQLEEEWYETYTENQNKPWYETDYGKEFNETLDYYTNLANSSWEILIDDDVGSEHIKRIGLLSPDEIKGGSGQKLNKDTAFNFQYNMTTEINKILTMGAEPVNENIFEKLEMNYDNFGSAGDAVAALGFETMFDFIGHYKHVMDEGGQADKIAVTKILSDLILGEEYVTPPDGSGLREGIDGTMDFYEFGWFGQPGYDQTREEQILAHYLGVFRYVDNKLYGGRYDAVDDVLALDYGYDLVYNNGAGRDKYFFKSKDDAGAYQIEFLSNFSGRELGITVDGEGNINQNSIVSFEEHYWEALGFDDAAMEDYLIQDGFEVYRVGKNVVNIPKYKLRLVGTDDKPGILDDDADFILSKADRGTFELTDANSKYINELDSSEIYGGDFGGPGYTTIDDLKITPSDIRLKENIELVGKSPKGINIYEFDYKDKSYGKGRYRGVMAQEVPNASFKYYNAYLWVDYNKTDVKFEKIK